MPSKRARSTKGSAAELYEVEVILGARRIDEPVETDPDSPHFGSGWVYLVKWWGYPDDENWWLPVSSLSGCQRLIHSFWDEIGHECLPTTLMGFVAYPRSEWVGGPLLLPSLRRSDRTVDIEAQEKQDYLKYYSLPPPVENPVSPKKQKHPQNRSRSTSGSPRTPTRKYKSTSHLTDGSPSIKIRLPATVSPSSHKTAYDTSPLDTIRVARMPPSKPPHTYHEPTATPPANSIFSHSPLSPPPTPEPEPEPAFCTSAQTEAELMAPVFAASDSMLESPAPTLVPDDHILHPRTLADVYLSSSAPAYNEDVPNSAMSGGAPIDSFDPSSNYDEMANLLLNTSVEDLLAGMVNRA
ncbi:hypothetical protein DFH09DRAFT_1358904 [Mycena vulgaris]|nr:hypothetical protein DFH09DRAFT_1358904 [Mycena vulgaris]